MTRNVPKPNNPHTWPCDCDNPACGLPLGRCFLCAQPVDTDRPWALCLDCVPRVEALREEEAAASDPTLCDDRCAGWAVFNVNACGGELQRCDQCGKRKGFVSDDDVAAHVELFYR